MIRAVFADWGHTLFDTAGSIDFLERWASARRHDVTRAQLEDIWAAAFARSRRPEELAKGRDTSAAVHRECWLAIYEDLDAVMPGARTALYEFETGVAGWHPFVDTAAFLHHLDERGIPLVVISDVPFDIRPMFAAHGLEHLVHTFVLSGEHGTVKAEGELYRLALATTGVPAAETLMVGDNPANDGQAVFHGIRTVLLPLVRSGEPRGFDTVMNLIP